MHDNRESGFIGAILLLGTAVLLSLGYFVISKTGLLQVNVGGYVNSYANNAPLDSTTFDQSNPIETPDTSTNVPTNAIVNPTAKAPTITMPISPFVLEPLTISLTDIQFTDLVNKYKPSDLPVGDITFTFSDNAIEATTVATSQIVQGPIKVVAIENKWFTITKVYLGTVELPPEMTTQINALVQDNMNAVLASLYMDGLRIESIKGHATQ